MAKKEEKLKKDAQEQVLDGECDNPMPPSDGGQGEEARSEDLEQKLKETEDRLLRTLAEYDNFRKRSQKEKEAAFSGAKITVINELLPVIDNFERAAGNESAAFEDYRKGINMIYEQLMSVISRLGVEPFGQEGEAFDPQIHNAVMHIEDENLGENAIAEVFAKGYRLGDKVIREAAVKVVN